MKKILLIGPRPSGKGGVCIWVGMILNYLKNNPNIVSLDLLDSTRSVSLTHLLPLYKKIWFDFVDYFVVLGKLVSQLFKKNYDILHIASSGGNGILRDFLFVCIAKLFKVRPFVHYHCGTIPLTLTSKSFLSLLLLFVARNSTIIVLDDASYSALKSKGFTKIYKIGNAYNPSIDAFYDSCNHRDPFDLLFVGHLVPEKGIFELLNALHDIPNIHLTCIGFENEIVKKSLIKYISESNFLGTVDFLGLQEPEVVYAAMAKSGLFVLPTHTEGFPFVIVEAMASGCPIVSTPVGAIEEMLTYEGEVQGVLVKPKDVENLKEVLLECQKSYSIFQAKAIKAREKALNCYSTNSIMKQLISLWNFGKCH